MEGIIFGILRYAFYNVALFTQTSFEPRGNYEWRKEREHSILLIKAKSIKTDNRA